MTATADWMTPEHRTPSEWAPDREQLTHVLRSLSARLDEMDRCLSDIAWNRRGRTHGVLPYERDALEAARARIAARLAVLAARLSDLDNTTRSDADGGQGGSWPQGGSCPGCGYPSLASGLCAFCQPMAAC